MRERKSLSSLVSNGMRAVTIDGRTADFDGLLRPGDRVDVLLSSGSVDANGTTQTLLQNLLVLSVGGTTQKDEPGAHTYSRGAAVSLSATAEQTQILTEATRRGKLTLTLRNSDDITILEGMTEVGARELKARSAAMPAAVEAPLASKPGVRNGK